MLNWGAAGIHVARPGGDDDRHASVPLSRALSGTRCKQVFQVVGCVGY